jgi:hypothetical protein
VSAERKKQTMHDPGTPWETQHAYGQSQRRLCREHHSVSLAPVIKWEMGWQRGGGRSGAQGGPVGARGPPELRGRGRRRRGGLGRNIAGHDTAVRATGRGKRLTSSKAHGGAGGTGGTAYRRTASTERGSRVKSGGGKKAAAFALEMEVAAHAAGRFND